MEANAAYHGGAPKLKAIAFKVVPDVNSVVAQLRTGELDVAVVTATHKETLSGAGPLPRLQDHRAAEHVLPRAQQRALALRRPAACARR